MAPKAHIAVIGAGVIGLQTSLHLLRAGYTVTLIAAHYPHDQAFSYTSPKAGAHWRSQSKDPFVHRADKETYLSWLSLLKSDPKGNTGLALVPSFYFWESAKAEGEDELWWKSYVLDFRVVSPEELPQGVARGVSYTTFAINPVQYMSYLLQECGTLGVRTVRRELGKLEEVFSVPGVEDVEAVVNCSGMGARMLVGDEDVYPIKGQTVLVRGECDAIKFRKTKSGWQDAVIRRPGEGTILGLSKDKNDWSENLDPELTAMILERCKELAPELLVNGEFDVIQAQIGQRPARKGGIRIETERIEVGGQEKIVCHHYGHGGTGFQNSVGSANEAVRILSNALELKSKL